MSAHVLHDPWRPKLYPAQEFAHPAPRNTTPPATPAQPQRIPTAIRAVQDSTVPPSGRTLIICLDGTGDKFDNDNSNVVHFVSCLKKDDPNQITYYQSGIGTYDGKGLTAGFSAAIDMAIGSGLGVHIRDAYCFLMENYWEGDKICLLGFSRGSYTVRCLAGMLHKVGLLPAGNTAQVSFAYEFYKNDTPEGWSMSAGFKKTFCTDVEVYFVGVWDCVASVGFIPRKLPFSKSPTKTIHYFRHAMALDEHRAKFKVCQWQHQQVEPAPKAQPGPLGRMLSSSRSGTGDSAGTGKRSSISFGSGIKKIDEHVAVSFSAELKKMEEKRDQQRLEMLFDLGADHHLVQTDVKEVWFAGAHADVGGGAVSNEKRHQLSRIPLRWMIRQCFECNTGILFGTAALAEIGLDVETVWPTYKLPKTPAVGPPPSRMEQYEAGALPPLSRRSSALGVDIDKQRRRSSGPKVGFFDTATLTDDEKHQLASDMLPEQVEDHFDAIAPINDQLVQARGWWILEAWPVKVYEKVHESSRWQKVVRMNMGRFRPIRDPEPNMHWTVGLRMGERGYKVRNMLDNNSVWQIAM